MEHIIELLGKMPLFTGLHNQELQYLAGLAERKEYAPNEWLFHELTPRQWFGVVERGEVRIIRRLQEQQTCIAVIHPGGIFSEGLLLDDLPHSSSGFTHEGAMVIKFSRGAVEQARKDRPDLFYRLVSRVAAIISDRLRYTAERLAVEDTAYLKGKTRREHDLLGYREVPAHAYYGIQTLRATENFPISGIKLSSFHHFLNALANCE